MNMHATLKTDLTMTAEWQKVQNLAYLIEQHESSIFKIDERREYFFINYSDVERYLVSQIEQAYVLNSPIDIDAIFSDLLDKIPVFIGTDPTQTLSQFKKEKAGEIALYFNDGLADPSLESHIKMATNLQIRDYIEKSMSGAMKERPRAVDIGFVYPNGHVYGDALLVTDRELLAAHGFTFNQERQTSAPPKNNVF